MITFNILPTILAVLLVTVVTPRPAASQGYKEWKKPEICIFGMPYIGHAVKRGNTGLIIEVLKAVFKAEGYELKHRNLPYKRSLAELNAGTIHCTLDVVDNLKGVIQGKSIITFYNLAVAHLAVEEFTGIESLAGHKVAYRHGFNLQSLLPVKIRPQIAYDLSSAFHMLDQNHVKFVLDDEFLLRDALSEAKLPSTEFTIKRLMSLGVRLIFASTDQGRKFRDIYDRRMQEMISSGQLQQVLRANGLGEESLRKILKANGH